MAKKIFVLSQKHLNLKNASQQLLNIIFSIINMAKEPLLFDLKSTFIALDLAAYHHKNDVNKVEKQLNGCNNNV